MSRFSQSPSSQPPPWADRLLEWFCAPHLLEEVQGDLYERFTRRAALYGERNARRQYAWEVLGFISRPFARKRQPSGFSSPEYQATFMLSPNMIRNYLKISFRTLTKRKVSTAINLVGLTIGVTACLVIYLITSFELSYDRFHPDRERIYRLVGKAQFGSAEEPHPVGFIPNAVPKAIREEIPGLETVAAFHNIESVVLIPNGNEKPKQFDNQSHGEIIVVEPQYFDIFAYQWLAGNPKTALNEPFKLERVDN